MLRNTSKLSPMQYLDRVYEQNQPELQVSATTVDEWKKWRRKLKRKVWELLEGMDDPKCDLKPQVVERTQMDGYVREKVIYSSRPELVPDSERGSRKDGGD
jgi:hypothetical protein